MERITYKLEPLYKKSIIETEIYTKYVDEDKKVEYYLHREILWRHGEFLIELNSREFNYLNENITDIIYLDKYIYEHLACYDVCNIEYNLYDNKGNKVTEGDFYDEIMNIINEDFDLIEEFDWYLDENIYSIIDGICLIKQ